MDKADFKSAIERFRQEGYDMWPDRVHIQIPDAKEHLLGGLRYFVGEKAQ